MIFLTTTQFTEYSQEPGHIFISLNPYNNDAKRSIPSHPIARKT